MPGLRHAHTLQQLKNNNEYSPPGEYLIIIWTEFSWITNKNNIKEIKTITIITKEVIIVITLVVVVCEHGVSPALKNPEVFILFT